MGPLLRCTAISNATKGGRIHMVNQTLYKVAMFDLGLKLS